jgi:hypothetical protein
LGHAPIAPTRHHGTARKNRAKCRFRRLATLYVLR